MAKIQNEVAYKAAMEKIEELLPLVDDDTPLTDRNLIELDLLSGLVEEYEDEHYPIPTPSLVDVIKGRCEPTLKVARDLSRKLNIDANIVLGV